MEQVQIADYYSAEMTSVLRCAYPNLSQDNISKFLVSPHALVNTKAFLTRFNYFLMGRLISVRAGFFLQEIVKLLKSQLYDACISIASGFSLLTNLVNDSLINHDITFIDSDTSNILSERNKRIDSHRKIQTDKKLNHFDTVIFDVNKSLTEGKTLKDYFSKYNNPLFVVEGLSYFLSKEKFLCLLKNISGYNSSAVIFDICSLDTHKSSQCLDRLLNEMPDFVCGGDAIYSLQTTDFSKALKNFKSVTSYDVAEAEELLLAGSEKLLLTDQDKFIPTKFIIAS